MTKKNDRKQVLRAQQDSLQIKASTRLTECACLDLSPTRRSGLGDVIKRTTSYFGIQALRRL